MGNGRVRVFLVEDEAAILRFVTGILQRMEDVCEVVGHAQNGVDALTEIGRLSPDIVITDIMMPMMDGLELMRHAAQACPEARFIVLTGHERFDFAQQAIELQAVSYLLKPINVEKLEKTVRDLAASIRGEREMRLRGQLRSIYLSHGRAQEDFHLSGGCLYLLLACRGEDALGREGATEVSGHSAEALEAMLSAKCGAACYALDTLNASEQCIVVMAENPCDDMVFSMAPAFGAAAFPGEGEVTVVLSECVTKESQIVAAMERMWATLADKQRFAKGGVLWAGTDALPQISHEASKPERGDPAAEKEMGLCWRIRRYLDTTLHQEFDRGALGAYFGYNKNYLTTLFSKCFGMSPGQYHTKQRIALAKALFDSKPDEKMQDVAARMGYSDALYFSRVFKAQTGYSPREYISRREKAESADLHRRG